MNHQFETMKQEYETIKASHQLKNRVEKIIKNDCHRSIIKLSISFAAGFLIVLVLSLNLSPSFAYAMEKVPALKPVVRVLTFGRYESHQNGYDAKIITPKIEGLLDKKLEEKLNHQFKENAKTLISAFEKDALEYSKDMPAHQTVTADYEVKTNNDHYLSIDCYILRTAADSNTIHSFYTIDKKTGKLLTLKDLFKENADYVTVLSDYILKEMIRQNKEEDAMFFTKDEPDYNVEGFKKIKKNQNFYINNDGNLVICFDKYEVAAGAQGSPEFVIPQKVISGIEK